MLIYVILTGLSVDGLINMSFWSRRWTFRNSIDKLGISLNIPYSIYFRMIYIADHTMLY